MARAGVARAGGDPAGARRADAIGHRRRRGGDAGDRSGRGPAGSKRRTAARRRSRLLRYGDRADRARRGLLRLYRRGTARARLSRAPRLCRAPADARLCPCMAGRGRHDRAGDRADGGDRVGVVAAARRRTRRAADAPGRRRADADGRIARPQPLLLRPARIVGGDADRAGLRPPSAGPLGLVAGSRRTGAGDPRTCAAVRPAAGGNGRVAPRLEGSRGMGRAGRGLLRRDGVALGAARAADRAGRSRQP